jgi:hypothetical protein
MLAGGVFIGETGSGDVHAPSLWRTVCFVKYIIPQISEAIFCLTEARKILDKGLGIRRSVFGNVVDPNLGPDTSTGAADPRNGFTDGPGSTGATSGGQ